MTDRHDGTSHPGPDADGPECACPADAGIARFFDNYTGESVAKGKEPEFAAVSQRLRDALVSIGTTGRTVLELGCGPGGLLLSLVEAGAERATGIDLSPGSLDVARQRFEAAGLGDRVDLATGDAARVELAQHDWVILDRSICCYPDIDRLLSNAILAARQLVAFSVPVSTGWRGTVARLYVAVDNAWNDWRGRPCPGFVHDIPVIRERLAAAGFRERLSGRQLLWHYAVFERAAETPEPQFDDVADLVGSAGKEGDGPIGGEGGAPGDRPLLRVRPPGVANRAPGQPHVSWHDSASATIAEILPHD